MEDNSRDLERINMYTSPHSILILNQDGKLLRLCCPFQVRTLRQVNVLQQGQVYYVSAVKVTPDLVMVYIISNTAYHYSLFIIM